MLVRMLDVGIVLLWLASVSALFVRDILPSWQAGNAPPTVSANHLRFMERSRRQAALFGPRGRRVGTNWVEYVPTHDFVLVKSTTVIDGLKLFPPLRIENRVQLRNDGMLDQFRIEVHGAPIAITMVGEDYGSDFACELKAGKMVHRWRMDSQTTRMVAEMFKPFTHLPHLRVGHSWQMRIVDPLAMLTGQSGGFETVLVRVTGMQDLHHAGKDIRCFVVEAPMLRALVAPQGDVIRQELDVPGLGRFVGVDEPFDRAALNRARGRVLGRPDPSVAQAHRRTAPSPGTTRPADP